MTFIRINRMTNWCRSCTDLLILTWPHFKFCACLMFNITMSSASTGHTQYDPRKPVPKRHAMPQPKVNAAHQPQLVPVSWWRGRGGPGERTLDFSSSPKVSESFLTLLMSGLSWQDSNYQCSVGSPSSRLPPPIIGAEDDDFDTEQEQVRTEKSSTPTESHSVIYSFCEYYLLICRRWTASVAVFRP